MELRLPKSIADCSPEQLSKWVMIVKDDSEIEILSDRLDFRVQVVSIFTGVDKKQLYDVEFNDLNFMYVEIINLLSNYEKEEPKGEVEINGQKYIFDKNFAHVTTGQIIELKLLESIEQKPYEVLATLYIEEGMKYEQKDDRDRVMNPTHKRVEIFRDDFTGDEYLNLLGFFFSIYEKQKSAMSILMIARMKEQLEIVDKEMDQLMSGTHGQE